jgi:D-amino-acid dehydrogenase
MLKNLALASFSLTTLRELRAELDLRYCERTHGTIKVFSDPASLAKAVAVAERLGEHGVVHRVLDRAGVAEVEPSLAPVAERLAGGILHPDDESGDAHLFVRKLAGAAEAAGVRFEFDTAVTGLRTEAGRIVAAATAAGDLSADACVLAAGSYSATLLAGLGLRLPVRPVKGYSITVPCADERLGPCRPVTDDTLHIAVTPFGDRLRVAGTAEFTGLDHSVGEPRIRNLRRMFETMFPDCAATVAPDTDLRPWSGLRPMSVDGVPVLGVTPLANLFLNTGHGHLGWTMAAGSGRAVARLVCGGEPELPLEPYRLDRF